MKLIITTSDKEKVNCLKKVSLSFFFWSKKKVEAPKDNTVEKIKIKGISNKKSLSSIPDNLIPKNQNIIKEKDLLNTSLINKKSLLKFWSINFINIGVIF